MPLTIHFLNVGQGDCTIIDFPSGRLTVIDINNGKTLDPSTRNEVLAQYRQTMAAQQQYTVASLAALVGVLMERSRIQDEEAKTTDPIAYLDHWFPNRDIFRLIISHPDMDHMTGLHRLSAQSGRRIENFWHSGNAEFNLASPQDWDSGPYDGRDWKAYKALRGSQQHPKALRVYAGQTADFWTADGITILSPTPAIEKKAIEVDKPNAISMSFLISYAGINVLLACDTTIEESWPDITNRLPANRISVLKASHHGRKSGYYQPAVKAMSPWLTITSVGQAEHDATESYRQYSDYTVSLRDAGDIRISIHEDGRWYYEPNISQNWRPKKTPPQLTLPPPSRF